MKPFLYLIVWSGGYEVPQYAAVDNEAEAWKIALDWKKEMDEGEVIDVLKVHFYSMVIDHLPWKGDEDVHA
jgi:hypothetical protein